MNYYIIIDLQAAYTGGATQAGLKQPPQIGGSWLFDLIDANGAVQQADCTAQAGADLTSLGELTAANFSRDVNAQLFPA